MNKYGVNSSDLLSSCLYYNNGILIFLDWPIENNLERMVKIDEKYNKLLFTYLMDNNLVVNLGNSYPIYLSRCESWVNELNQFENPIKVIKYIKPFLLYNQYFVILYKYMNNNNLKLLRINPMIHIGVYLINSIEDTVPANVSYIDSGLIKSFLFDSFIALASFNKSLKNGFITKQINKYLILGELIFGVIFLSDKTYRNHFNSIVKMKYVLIIPCRMFNGYFIVYYGRMVTLPVGYDWDVISD